MILPESLSNKHKKCEKNLQKTFYLEKYNKLLCSNAVVIFQMKCFQKLSSMMQRIKFFVFGTKWQFGLCFSYELLFCQYYLSLRLFFTLSIHISLSLFSNTTSLTIYFFFSFCSLEAIVAKILELKVGRRLCKFNMYVYVYMCQKGCFSVGEKYINITVLKSLCHSSNTAHCSKIYLDIILSYIGN